MSSNGAVAELVSSSEGLLFSRYGTFISSEGHAMTPETLIENSRRRKAAQAAYDRQRYVNNIDEGRARARAYYWAHREEQKARRNKYHSEHKKERLAYEAVASQTPKGRARKAMHYAVKVGRLVKPSRCSGCGRFVSRARLHGHHDDYAKPLDVRWLCAKCHGVTRRIRDGEKEASNV